MTKSKVIDRLLRAVIKPDEDFAQRLDDFLYGGYETYSMSDRQVKLSEQEKAVNNRLTELLKDQEQARALFWAYEGIRDSMEGETTSVNYERGFADGINFLIAFLRRDD